MSHETIVYEGVNAPSLNVLTDGETVWLTQAQMCQLFGRDQSVIARHVRNILKEGELEAESAYAKFAYTASDGKTYQVGYYNLDVLISVGYRVKSVEGVRFRQWATRCLRDILLRKMKTEGRLSQIENRLAQVENGLAQLADVIANPEPFYDENRRMIGFASEGGVE